MNRNTFREWCEKGGGTLRRVDGTRATPTKIVCTHPTGTGKVAVYEEGSDSISIPGKQGKQVGWLHQVDELQKKGNELVAVAGDSRYKIGFGKNKFKFVLHKDDDHPKLEGRYDEDEF